MARSPLARYTEKRDPERTPEPMPDPDAATGTDGRTFVIQEHHASSLHWDFRLERDGVLVSWALPKGLPTDPDRNHLAVRVEDHPLEYGGFTGTIPDGQYGAGRVTIWDHGSYVCEKWTEREVMVVLHGARTDGRFVLFPTRGKNWMIHRMDPRPPGNEALPTSLSPMLAVAGTLPEDDDGWAYEFKWDGARAIVAVEGGRPTATSRNGLPLAASFPELRPMAEALGSTRVLLDGELVVLGPDRAPSFSRIQHRLKAAPGRAVDRAASADPAHFVVFDLLHLDGHSLLGSPYDDRRAALEGLGLAGPNWAVTPSFTDSPGADVLGAALGMGMEGVMAKRRDSRYLPGRRSASWIKVKPERTQEVVLAGWTTGKGNRAKGIGALVLGIPDGDVLGFVGKVGSGFTEETMRDLLGELRPRARRSSPFATRPAGLGDVHWVEPDLVGEVRFAGWTADGRLRQPTWRGRRPDKRPDEVVRES